jgi:hypothetical protein
MADLVFDSIGESADKAAAKVSELSRKVSELTKTVAQRGMGYGGFALGAGFTAAGSSSFQGHVDAMKALKEFEYSAKGLELVGSKMKQAEGAAQSLGKTLEKLGSWGNQSPFKIWTDGLKSLETVGTQTAKSLLTAFKPLGIAFHPITVALTLGYDALDKFHKKAVEAGKELEKLGKQVDTYSAGMSRGIGVIAGQAGTSGRDIAGHMLTAMRSGFSGAETARLVSLSVGQSRVTGADLGTTMASNVAAIRTATLGMTEAQRLAYIQEQAVRSGAIRAPFMPQLPTVGRAWEQAAAPAGQFGNALSGWMTGMGYSILGTTPTQVPFLTRARERLGESARRTAEEVTSIPGRIGAGIIGLGGRALGAAGRFFEGMDEEDARAILFGGTTPRYSQGSKWAWTREQATGVLMRIEGNKAARAQQERIDASTESKRRLSQLESMEVYESRKQKLTEMQGKRQELFSKIQAAESAGDASEARRLRIEYAASTAVTSGLERDVFGMRGIEQAFVKPAQGLGGVYPGIPVPTIYTAKERAAEKKRLTEEETKREAEIKLSKEYEQKYAAAAGLRYSLEDEAKKIYDKYGGISELEKKIRGVESGAYEIQEQEKYARKKLASLGIGGYKTKYDIEEMKAAFEEEEARKFKESGGTYKVKEFEAPKQKELDKAGDEAVKALEAIQVNAKNTARTFEELNKDMQALMAKDAGLFGNLGIKVKEFEDNLTHFSLSQAEREGLVSRQDIYDIRELIGPEGTAIAPHRKELAARQLDLSRRTTMLALQKELEPLQQQGRIRMAGLMLGQARGIGIETGDISEAMTSGIPDLQNQGEKILEIRKSMFQKELQFTVQYTEARINAIKAHYDKIIFMEVAFLNEATNKMKNAVDFASTLHGTGQAALGARAQMYGTARELVDERRQTRSLGERAEDLKRAERDIALGFVGMQLPRPVQFMEQMDRLAREKRNLQEDMRRDQEDRAFKQQYAQAQVANVEGVFRTLGRYGVSRGAYLGSPEGSAQALEMYRGALPHFQRLGRGQEALGQIDMLLGRQREFGARKFVAQERIRGVEAESMERQIAELEKGAGGAETPEGRIAAFGLMSKYQEAAQMYAAQGKTELAEKYSTKFAKTFEGLPPDLKAVYDKEKGVMNEYLKQQVDWLKAIYKVLAERGIQGPKAKVEGEQWGGVTKAAGLGGEKAPASTQIGGGPGKPGESQGKTGEGQDYLASQYAPSSRSFGAAMGGSGASVGTLNVVEIPKSGHWRSPGWDIRGKTENEPEIRYEPGGLTPGTIKSMERQRDLMEQYSKTPASHQAMYNLASQEGIYAAKHGVSSFAANEFQLGKMGFSKARLKQMEDFEKAKISARAAQVEEKIEQIEEEKGIKLNQQAEWGEENLFIAKAGYEQRRKMVAENRMTEREARMADLNVINRVAEDMGISMEDAKKAIVKGSPEASTTGFGTEGKGQSDFASAVGEFKGAVNELKEIKVDVSVDVERGTGSGSASKGGASYP